MTVRRSRAWYAVPIRLAVALLLVVACSSPTDVGSLTVSLRTFAFATQEERDQWLSSPTIEGGESLVVRGMAFVGCGRPEAGAQRRDNVVGVEVRAVDTDNFCLGIVPGWLPVEVTVSGLAPGAYRVRVGMAGLPEREEASATIVAP